ncbi:MAG TPA: DMT family transporter [Candidatus Nanoarchaeia archaeon]|nr:DMT family transporter [Candidatus Nanoarchaeia archaeon]
MNKKTLGVFSIIAASIVWAIEPILVKLSYVNSDFLHTSSVRAIFVAAIALIYVFMANKGNLRVNKKQLSALFYIAFAATVTAELLYFYAIAKIPIVNAVLVGHMQPIFIVLMSYVVLKDEKLTKFDYFGILFMIIAGLLVTTRTFVNLYSLKLGTFEDFLVLISAILWATTSIVMRKYLMEVNSGVITFYRYTISFIALTGYLILNSYFAISNIYQVMLGLIVGVGTILYYEGLKRLKAAQVGALELSTPFFAAILSFFILGEITTTMQIFGICLLFVGVFMLSRHEK